MITIASEVPDNLFLFIGFNQLDRDQETPCAMLSRYRSKLELLVFAGFDG